MEAESLIKKLISSLILGLFISTSSFAHFVDGVRLQHAGEIGFVSLGINKIVSEKYQLSFLYGYVPSAYSEKPIETISLKQDYFFYDGNLSSLNYDYQVYLGVNIYHVIGLRYQSSQAKEAPFNYYQMASIRALLYLGLETGENGMPSRYYFEMGMNDIWLVNYVTNHDALEANDYLSLALGYKYLFQ